MFKHSLVIEANTSLDAWEKVNEYIYKNEKELQSAMQGRDGNSLFSYNNTVYIKRPYIPDDFNFGRVFGHRMQKWRSLVNNYVDFDYLDIIASEVRLKEKSKNTKYNIALHFKNTHLNGKDCLISLTFTRRLDHDCPVIHFYTRACEVTKRMLWDLLLVQRMGEYVYGKNDFAIYFYAPMMFLNAESFLLYHVHKSIKKLYKKLEDPQPFQKKVMVLLDKYSTVNPIDISYKSHRRAANQIQTDKDGIPLSGNYIMCPPDLQLFSQPGPVQYPPEVFTESQRKEYRKNIRNRK